MRNATYGDVKVAVEIDDAALDFDVLQMRASFRAEEVLLEQFLELRLLFGKVDCAEKRDACFFFLQWVGGKSRFFTRPEKVER